MLSDRVMNNIKTIAENEGFLSYDISLSDGSNHGDNFVGIITAIKISGPKVIDDKVEELHLVCKAPPANESRKRNFNYAMTFSREIYVYAKVLPAFVRFQKEKGLSDGDSFISFPKVYAYELDAKSDTFILIMEDMRSKNYQMWPKEKVIRLDYELAIMRELGKFHAVSFAMKDQQSDEFNEFTEMEDTFYQIVINGRMRSFNNKALEKAAKVLENPQHKQLVTNFRQTFPNVISEFVIGESSKEFAVIGHGDTWCNNILFQDSDDTVSIIMRFFVFLSFQILALMNILNIFLLIFVCIEISLIDLIIFCRISFFQDNQSKNVCFLDWQLCKYCPPVLDLHYNIFSITDKQFRANHYNTLLETYYTSLSTTIRKLGSDPNKLYTFENFQSQLRKFAEYALLCGPVLLQFKVASAKDIKDLDDYCELIEKGEEADLINEFDEKTKKEYSTLINDLVSDLIDLEYIEIK